MSKEIAKRSESFTKSTRQQFLDDLEQFYRVNIKGPIDYLKRTAETGGEYIGVDDKDQKWAYTEAD